MDNTLSWKSHVDMIIPKLRTACFAVRAVKPVKSQETLEMVCYSYFHSIMNYGLIFWGNSSYSIYIFRLQKRIIRIIMGGRTKDSSREIFKILNILPLQSQHIHIVRFVVDNKNQFKVNSEVRTINTRNNSNLFQPLTHLKTYQRGSYYLGFKRYIVFLLK